MSNKTDAAYHGSTLRDELLRVAPFSEDGTLLRRAAERIAELEAAGRLDLAEAWDEGSHAAWAESGEGWNGEYPGLPFQAREFPNPYRTP